MSLPPTTVHIKRKRTDEPVDYLRIHEGNDTHKRQRVGFVFERQTPTIPETATPIITRTLENDLLGTRTIKPLHRTSSSQILSDRNQQASAGLGSGTQSHHTNSLNVTHQPEQPRQNPPTAETTRSIQPSQFVQPAQIRRFHISRSVADEDSTPTGLSRKRKESPIVFVERKARPKTPDTATASHGTEHQETFPQEAIRAQKKPGKNARTKVQPSPGLQGDSVVTAQKAPVPSPFRYPRDVTSEKFAKEMEAFTLQEIGHNLARMEESNPRPVESPPLNRQSTPSKFKPKAPALRYAERHPESQVISRLSTNTSHEVVDEDMDDGDYVTETYIRVPVELLDATTSNFGLLILESQPDIEEFFGNDFDSDEEDEFEDEDENAENHYSADYPDEEVDSDDEYGRNAYSYRNNASDDEFDATYSDSEDESTKYPWRKRPSYLTHTDDDSD